MMALPAFPGLPIVLSNLSSSYRRSSVLAFHTSIEMRLNRINSFPWVSARFGMVFSGRQLNPIDRQRGSKHQLSAVRRAQPGHELPGDFAASHRIPAHVTHVAVPVTISRHQSRFPPKAINMDRYSSPKDCWPRLITTSICSEV